MDERSDEIIEAEEDAIVIIHRLETRAKKYYYQYNTKKDQAHNLLGPSSLSLIEVLYGA